jgi:hypothetical protein
MKKCKLLTFILFVFLIINFGCNNSPDKPDTGSSGTETINKSASDSMTPAQCSIVQDSVRKMAESITRNVNGKGPVAWLRYFENSPGFFMVSDGQLVFPNYDSATNFIENTLIKNITKIKLQWSNIRIDPITCKSAGMAANFHENITYSSGKTVPADGYFTAIVRQTSDGWKLHNAHWSSKSSSPK